MHTELNLPNPKILVKAVNTWVSSAFGNVLKENADDSVLDQNKQKQQLGTFH